jgi:hypothetical protein
MCGDGEDRMSFLERHDRRSKRECLMIRVSIAACHFLYFSILRAWYMVFEEPVDQVGYPNISLFCNESRLSLNYRRSPLSPDAQAKQSRQPR